MIWPASEYFYARAALLRLPERRRDAARLAGPLNLALILAAGMLAASWTMAAAAQRNFTLDAARKRVSIGAGLSYNAWTYDGTVPGPTLKAKQGDDVGIHLRNRTAEAHGIEIMAARIAPERFSGDPTGNVDYSFKADVPGVFDYHCSAIPVLDHVASGMYGMMIVEPAAGWPNGPAQEMSIIQGEFYGTPDISGLVVPNHTRMLAADPDFVVFNGAMSRYGQSSPLKIEVGKLTRIFFVNAGPNLASTFHIMGVIFSTVYESGNPADALHDVPSFTVGPGQGAVFEFKVDEPGDYRFADTAGAHSYKGALGVIRATK